jgi:hypothetical protein
MGNDANLEGTRTSSEASAIAELFEICDGPVKGGEIIEMV